MVSSQKISGCSSKIICRELWNAAYTCFSVYPLMLTVILSLFALSPLRKVLCMLSASLSFASWVLHRSYSLEELLDFLLLELLCSVLVDGVLLPGLPRAAEVLTAMLSTIAIARAVERIFLNIISPPNNFLSSEPFQRTSDCPHYTTSHVDSKEKNCKIFYFCLIFSSLSSFFQI